MVQSAVDRYVDTNKELPENLSDLELRGDAKTLVDQNLIEYNPNTKPPSTPGANTNRYNQTATTHYYTLCVNYRKESRGYNYNTYPTSYQSKTDDGYSTYVSAYEHSAGQVCYKLKIT
jgi:hypothetical protein